MVLVWRLNTSMKIFHGLLFMACSHPTFNCDLITPPKWNSIESVLRRTISRAFSGLLDPCADYSLCVLKFCPPSTHEAKYHFGTKKWIFQYWESRAWPAKGILILQLCGKGVQVNVTAQFSRRRLENIPEELAVKFAWSNSCENIAFEKKRRWCNFGSYWILWLVAA